MFTKQPSSDKPARIWDIKIGKIKDQQKLEFAQDLKLLINTGMPIQEGLATIIEQAKPGIYRDFLLQAKSRIEKGSSLYSVCKESRHFDHVFVNFIKIGEETGNLPQSLNFLFEWLDNSLTLKREISTVTLYPKILIAFAIIVGLGLSIWILPNVVGVVEGLGVEPFITTRILLAVSNFMKDHGIYVALGIFVLFILFKISSRLPLVKRVIDGLTIRLPVVGSFFRDYQLTIISQVALTLYRSGIPVSQIFRIIAESSPNFYYRESMIKTTESVEKGTSPSKAIAEFPNLYPSTFINIVAVGEKAGSLETSFSYLAKFFQDRLARKTKILPTIIEPIVLLIIGLFIAFVATAVILPIYEVTQGI